MRAAERLLAQKGPARAMQDKLAAYGLKNENDKATPHGFAVGARVGSNRLG